MDEKISLKALEDYSDDYSSKVTASFFSAKEKITGPEILALCDIQQINLFVIRELLQAWKLESQKLHSPYFDYTAPKVAEALTLFQNQLSNSISISRENFQPLLKKAVSSTLFLILDPYDFYSETLDTQGNQLKIEDLRNHVKYIRINRTPLEKLLQELEAKKLQTLGGNEAFASLDHILEEVNFTPEDIDDYVTRFSKIVPLQVEKLYEHKAQPTPPKVHAEQPKQEVKKAVVQTPAQPEPEKKSPPPQVPLYDQQPGKGSTLAENFQKTKKIKDVLTINQKFMFTKILFNGDFELFSAAIERLDELDSLTQAKTFLSNNYGEWNPESEEYQEFMEVVERRFA
ncbi:MAG: hypothetical protein JNK10_01200 [Cyclobacteriaceae bacterium]|nr:hypothetical protein [Cyclobacteriaceae bacterium]